MTGPNKDIKFPLANYKRLCFLKNTVKNPNIIIGDYTYYDDFENIENFEKNVKYHFDFLEDKLIIGKFCMIASDVKFIMNGANHLTSALTTYPFAIFGNGWENAMDGKSYPQKGDINIGNDVWIGYNATAIKDVEPYSIVGGNPAKEIKKRFSKDIISKLLELKWWNWDIEKITKNVQSLTDNNFEKLAD
jgi:virginiamycin A acetyltransferase